MSMPSQLRARLAADYAAVQPLRSPAMRALWVAPFAAIALLAAPTFFSVRSDSSALGWALSWGASLAQAGLGFAMIIAALRESVPGRALPLTTLVALILVPIALVIT